MEQKKTAVSDMKTEEGWELNEDGMPPARVVAAERAREEAFSRALQAEDDSSCSSSDTEAALVGALAALAVPPARAAPATLPDAATLVARISTAMKDRDTTFLDEYLRIVTSKKESHIKIITDELMTYVERMPEAEGAAAAAARDRGGWGGVLADGVVVAGWLACAVLWRAPRVPAAPRALHALVALLPAAQVEELARALYETLQSGSELLQLSDVLRGAAARAGGGAGAGAEGGAGGGTGGAELLAELLLRAALARAAGVPVIWKLEPLSVQETTEVLSGRWAQLPPAQQLTAARLAGRVLAAAASRCQLGGGEGARLLAALAQPPPHELRHHPDYSKVSVALSKLEVLFKAAEDKPGASTRNRKTKK